MSSTNGEAGTTPARITYTTTTTTGAGAGAGPGAQSQHIGGVVFGGGRTRRRIIGDPFAHSSTSAATATEPPYPSISRARGRARMTREGNFNGDASSAPQQAHAVPQGRPMNSREFQAQLQAEEEEARRRRQAAAVSTVSHEDRPVVARGAYDLSFLDTNNEYERIGRVQNGDESPRETSDLMDGIQEFMSALAAAAAAEGGGDGNGNFLTDEEFERQFPYERLVDLDQQLARRGGLTASQFRKCLRFSRFSDTDRFSRFSDTDFQTAATTTTTTTRDCSESNGSAQEAEDQNEDPPLRSCTVCLDSYVDGEELAQLPCQHWFHSQCVQRWLTSNTSCPLCRWNIEVVEEKE